MMLQEEMLSPAPFNCLMAGYGKVLTSFVGKCFLGFSRGFLDHTKVRIRRESPDLTQEGNLEAAEGVLMRMRPGHA